MALINPEIVQMLKTKNHDYTKMNKEELLRVVKSASHQDSGKYGGQFVGFCAYMELVRKENNESFEQNKKLALDSIKIAKYSFFIAIGSMVITLAALVTTFVR